MSKSFSTIDMTKLQTHTLNLRQRCDLELILNKGFDPLTSFLSRADYNAVLSKGRLANGKLWPIPVVLDVSKKFADTLSVGSDVALQDFDGTLYAVLTVAEIWQPNKLEEAQAVYGTDQLQHPGVKYLLKEAGEVYIGGTLHPVKLPIHFDFEDLRNTPEQQGQKFQEKKWDKVIAFQTRNPMHRAHYEITLRACEEAHARLLIHPTVGMTKPGDIDYYIRVNCYKQILSKYPANKAMLSLLPLAMRMAGPKEALWHALIRKNYHCTGFIVGRDHAGPVNEELGTSFYPPYAAQELALQHEKEMGIDIIPFEEMVYVKETHKYLPESQVKPAQTVMKLSGSDLRRRLRERMDIPDWFSYPEVISELRKLYPPKDEQGFTLFFTGYSGAGKSTMAQALRIKLQDLYERPVTLLDGDIVRKLLSSELGFSREDRELNIRRIGFIASEITKHKGIAICSLIAPFSEVRKQVRQQISENGGFIEIYLSTPLEVCEGRNPKGIYAKARAGIIKEFTGISSPYEPPENPEIEIDTSQYTLRESVQLILDKLKALGYLN